MSTKASTRTPIRPQTGKEAVKIAESGLPLEIEIATGRHCPGPQFCVRSLL